VGRAPLKQPTNDRGLTAVELIIVIALVSLLAGVAVASAGRMSAAARARAGAEHLASLLSQAITLASSENTQARVVLTRGAWPPRVELMRSGTWVDVTAELARVRTAATPPGQVWVASTTYPSDTFTAGRDTQSALVVASEGTATLEAGYGMTARVQTTRLGRVCLEVCP